MLKRLAFFLCFAAFSLIATQQESTEARSDSDTDSDEVYAAVVSWRTYDPGPAPKPKQLVFLDTTAPDRCFVPPERCPSATRQRLTESFGQALDEDLLDDYFEQNKDQGPLSKSFPTLLPKSWLSQAEREAIFKNGLAGWQVFYARYPESPGFMAFSRVAFNEKRDTALLYSSLSCGGLCGTGYYHFLKKVSGKWILTKNYMVWIS